MGSGIAQRLDRYAFVTAAFKTVPFDHMTNNSLSALPAHNNLTVFDLCATPNCVYSQLHPAHDMQVRAAVDASYHCSAGVTKCVSNNSNLLA